MAAISQLTSTIRLGQMVGCNSYRNPALLAKITSTVDVVSGGRLDWGIGAGWYELEYRGYGYEFPTPKDRIGMLRETVEIVTSLWSQPETTYKGELLRGVAGQLRPQAAAGPAPAGLDRRRRRAADAARRRPPRRLLELRRAARAVGAQARRAAGPLRRGRPGPRRDPHDVVARGVHPPDRGRGRWPPARAACGASRPSAGGPATSSARRSRSPRRCRTYVDLGCRGFIPWCADYPDTETLELLRDRGHARVPLTPVHPSICGASGTGSGQTLADVLAGSTEAVQDVAGHRSTAGSSRP